MKGYNMRKISEILGDILSLVALFGGVYVFLLIGHGLGLN